MPGYDAVVGDALRASVVGGSDACADAVRAAFDAIGEIIADPGGSEGRRGLERKFRLCSDEKSPLDDPADVAEAIAALTEIIPAQSNDPACDNGPVCDIARVCAAMLDEGKGRDAVDRLAWVAAAAFSGSEVLKERRSPRERGRMGTSHDDDDDVDDCVDVSHAKTLARLSDESLPTFDTPKQEDDYGWDRSWQWQTCAEFGFYQTCEDASSCLFRAPALSPPPLSLASFVDVCVAVFGANASAVAAAPGITNERYGGWRPGSTRVLFASGSIDPWRALSLTPDRSVNEEWLPTMMVEVRSMISHHTGPRTTASAWCASILEDFLSRARLRFSPRGRPSVSTLDPMTPFDSSDRRLSTTPPTPSLALNEGRVASRVDAPGAGRRSEERRGREGGDRGESGRVVTRRADG